MSETEKRLADLEARVALLEERSPRTKKFEPPTLEEVKAYVAEKGYHFSPELFWNRNTENNWTTRDSRRQIVPMISWKGVCATWEGNWRESHKMGSDEQVAAKTAIAIKDDERMKKLQAMAEEQLKKIRAASSGKEAEDTAALQRPEMDL